MELIIFGIEQMNPGAGRMKALDLFLQGDELVSFLGIGGNGDACDGKFNAALGFDGCGDDGVVAEDFLDLVGVGGHAANTDAGVTIVGEFRAAETERVGRIRNEG